jgi:uroporphyrinogen decarboxylase
MANMDRIVPWAGEFFIGCDISPCVFEMVCRIVGMEGAVFDLAARPERSAFMLAQAAEFSRRLAEEACRKFPLDWLWTGDDVAGQQSMIMNPAVWRRMVRPHLEEIVGVGKSHGLRVAYHCCGAVRPIIPDLVEMGVDVLNPVQHGCPGMDPGELKREFGSRMTFMGGIDTQDLLPHGTPGEVRRETSRLVETMTSDGGGYILAASHTVPPETPLENIFAMYEAAGVGRGEIYARAADVRTKERLRDLR